MGYTIEKIWEVGFLSTALTIQDLSCLGRAAGAIALGVLQAMGMEAVLLPTAVLSTQTLFPSPVVRDLSDFLEPAAAHWQSQGIRFEGICTGYLANPGQCQQVLAIIDQLAGPDTLVVVDPAMADNGKLYACLSPEQPQAMRALCARADVILPNRTEAALLTGLPMDTDPHDLCRALMQLGCREVLLTGYEAAPGSLGTLAYDGRDFAQTSHRRLPASFHGTGDLFTSVYFGARLHGCPGQQAAELAGTFVADAIENTPPENGPQHRGVRYEPLLWRLGQRLQTISFSQEEPSWERNLN